MRIERIDAGVDASFRVFGRLEGLACRHLLRMLNGPVSDGSVVTVELEGLETCDARGAEALVSLTKRARDAGGNLVLTAPRAAIVDELDAAGVLSALQFAPAVSAAGEPGA